MSEWQPIETAPTNQRILACFWHSCEYHVVTAKYAKKWGTWHDEREESCVGWVPESQWTKKPRMQGYWMPLPPPPIAPTTQEN